MEQSTVMSKKSNSMEMLGWTEKKEQYTSFTGEGEGGVFGVEGGYTFMYKNVQMKQKAGYQRHVFHVSNQAVRQ